MCTFAFAGALVSGISGFAQMQSQAANYRAEQQAAERDAALRRESGAYEAARTQEQGAQLIGKQVATYGGRGIAPSTGTAADTIASTGADVGLDIEAARYGTARAIENDQYRAKVAGMNASNASFAAPFAFVSPIISAGASFFRPTYLNNSFATVPTFSGYGQGPYAGRAY